MASNGKTKGSKRTVLDLTDSVVCAQAKGKKLSIWWVLLDNQSTCNLFTNPLLLINIREVDEWLDVYTHNGVSSTNMKGEFPGVGDVWFDKSGIANILSLAKMKKLFHIQYDNWKEDAFLVHKPDGAINKFVESHKGLHYLDLEERFKKKMQSKPPTDKETEGCNEEAVALITTVADNKSKFSVTDYDRAEKARRLQRILFRPSTREYGTIINDKKLPNCTVQVQDIKNAEYIWGPDLGSLKGKTTWTQGGHVTAAAPASIPPMIHEQYRDITLCADIMFVNKIPFFVTISRHLRFATSENIGNMKIKTIQKSLRQIKAAYAKRGFRIRHAHMDGQFEPLMAVMAEMQITLNVTSADEHVPEIERWIRTCKERCRAVICMLPFKKLPRRLIVELIYAATFWLNSFPKKHGISATISPRTIITGLELDFNKHCALEFCEYCQTHEETDSSMRTRTVGALALRPTGNAQGGYYFLSLHTGKRLNRKRWTPLPMPREVEDQVHRLAQKQKTNPGVEFCDRNKVRIDDTDEDDDDDLTYYDDNQPPEPIDGAGVSEDESEDEPISDDEDDLRIEQDGSEQDAQQEADDLRQEATDLQQNLTGEERAIMNDEPLESTGVRDEPLESTGVQEHDDDAGAQETEGNTGVQEDTESTGVQETDSEAAESTGVNENRPQDEDEDEVLDRARDEAIHDEARELSVAEQFIPGNNANDAEDDGEQPTEEEQSTDNGHEVWGQVPTAREVGGHSLRPRRPRHYNFVMETIPSHKRLGLMLASVDYSQHTMNKGLKIFRERGVDAVLKEMKQLDYMDVCEPVAPEDMSTQERKRALRYLMFLKEKRDGKIKGRGCVDGRPQREYTAKEESTAPTVSIEAFMITCMVDALEGRDVATVDIPGAFMQTEQDELVHVKLEGIMVDLLLKVAPGKYDKEVRYHGNKPYLYTRLKKALYGQLKAALLFWKNLSGKLKSWGFEINDYDWCVANKTINGEQCTIVWHVDDLKISHVDPEVVSLIIGHLSKEYGKHSELSVTRGKIHEYLGMTIDYRKEGNVRISMFKYMQELLSDLPDDMDGMAVTPAAEHLFKVNETDPTKLSDDLSDFFHTNVAKLLFLCKRARPDIQTAVSFLCTRVQSPDTDDYKKLGRVMKYLRRTIAMPLTLKANNMSIIKWWVDASFAVHKDMRSHTGQVMSLGRGAGYASSGKQKINTTSSTEAELVGMADALRQVLWTRYFIEAQGYDVKDNVVFRDNQASMRLERNGRGSSTKRTRHIEIRYFFVTDRIEKNDLSVIYCPTEEMTADYLTKALQGKLFKKFRDEIMNCEEYDAGYIDSLSTAAA